MPVKLNQFASGPITGDSTLVGYQTPTAGGERRWTASALRDWLLSEIGTRLVPVGTVSAFPATQPPAGWIKLNGAVLNRSQYAALWAYAQGSGNLVSEAQWYSAANTVNRWGSFSIGDGINTFRLPEVRGEFIRAWDDGRNPTANQGWGDHGRILGSHQGDAIRNIVGQANTNSTASYVGAANVSFATGNGRRALKEFVSQTRYKYSYGSGTYFGSNIGFDASAVVPTTTDDNRPRNLAMLYCIKF